MMQKLQELFEKYYKVRGFKAGALFCHCFFLFLVFWFSQKSERTFVADLIFVSGIICFTLYWKLFAKMKKKEFDARQ